MEPISEVIIRDHDHGAVSANDVRGARYKFYEAMALHLGDSGHGVGRQELQGGS